MRGRGFRDLQGLRGAGGLGTAAEQRVHGRGQTRPCMSGRRWVKGDTHGLLGSGAERTGPCGWGQCHRCFAKAGRGSKSCLGSRRMHVLSGSVIPPGQRRGNHVPLEHNALTYVVCTPKEIRGTCLQATACLEATAPLLVSFPPTPGASPSHPDTCRVRWVACHPAQRQLASWGAQIAPQGGPGLYRGYAPQRTPYPASALQTCSSPCQRSHAPPHHLTCPPQ